MIDDFPELLQYLEQQQLVEHRFPNTQLKQTWHQDCGKQLVGRANDLKYDSSWMIVGIADDGRVLGKDESWAKQQEQIISQHINQYLDPNLACTHLSCYCCKHGWVIIIALSNPGVVVRWNGKPYKSAGTSHREMEPDEALALTVQLPGLHDYSAQDWIGAVQAENVIDFARRISSKSGNVEFQDIARLSALEILNRLGIGSKATSRILFGDFSCRVVKYDIAGAVLQNSTVRPLYTLLTRDFQANLSQSRGVDPAQVGLWPALALSEGLANAVAHASYFDRGGDIMIEVSPTTLCISNLCTKEAAAFANKWFSRSHQALNVLLMESLRLGGFVDELGRGKRLILREFLLLGRRPPFVTIEPAGRSCRWRLFLPTQDTDGNILRVLDRIRDWAGADDNKALLAFALCLWRDKPFSEIRKHIDADNEVVLQNILSDIRSPVFLVDENDRLYLLRWVQLLLSEGLDSKQFAPEEEKRLYQMSRKIHLAYHGGLITPKQLRQLGQMGETMSERALSSLLLRKWERRRLITRVKKGVYQFAGVDAGE